MADQDQIPTHLEDVPERPTDPARVLSDDELRASGLEPVRAYVRTKAGKAADRQQRYREKQQAAGMKQTNILVPDEHRETIREIARRLREGEPLEAAITPEKAPERPQERNKSPVMPSGTPSPTETPDALSEADKRLIAAAKAGGVRSRLIRFLAGL